MKFKKVLISLLAGLLVSFALSAQEYQVNNDLSNIYIDGTSSLHDWTETVETIHGTLKADVEGAKLEKLRSLQITIPVKSIKSGKSGMDKNTYAALKEDKFPEIKYVLKTFKIEEETVKLTGDMTIAGVTKSVSSVAKANVQSGKVEFTGEFPIKMTTFGVEPPTAVMGTIKTGDDLTIKYHLYFN